MSIIRLIWVYTLLFYAFAITAYAFFVVPHLEKDAQKILKERSQNVANQVGRDFSQSTSIIQLKDTEIQAIWIDLLKRQAMHNNWSMYIFTDSSGVPLLQYSSSKVFFWESVLTPHLNQAHGETSLIYNGKLIGYFKLTVSSVEETEKIKTHFIFASIALLILLAIQVFILRIIKDWIYNPIERFKYQMQSIVERKFVQIQESKIPEWTGFSSALNIVVSRIKQLIEDRENTVGELNERISHDSLTHVASRESFMAALNAELFDGKSNGSVVIVRINELESINRRLGRNYADELIIAVATTLRTQLMLMRVFESSVLARLNGADFGLLLRNCDETICNLILNKVSAALEHLVEDKITDSIQIAWIGGATYRVGESATEILMRVDSMLMLAEAEQESFKFTVSTARNHLKAIVEWRILIENALDTGHFNLIFNKVYDENNVLIHKECILQLIDPFGTPIAARDFVPAAVRCGRSMDVDLKAVEIAIAELKKSTGKVAIRISLQSLKRPLFLKRLKTLLSASPEISSRLIFELDEPLLNNKNSNLVKAFCEAVKKYGSDVGFSNFGINLTLVDVISCEVIKYVKLAPSLTSDLDNLPRAMAFIQLLIGLAKDCNFDVYVAEPHTYHNMKKLSRLGVNGFVTRVA